MEIRRGPAAVLAGVIIVAVVLLIVLGGGDDSSTPTSSKASGKPAVIQIRDGAPVGGVQDLTFTQGGRITFTVKSDQAFEIHFHGYDVAMDVTPQRPVTFDVPARISGAFDVEIEDTATQIAEVSVEPG